MKLLSREQIEDLAKFKSEKYFTTSFFLDTKKRRQTKKEILLAVKNLTNKAKSILQDLGSEKAVKESALKDLAQIQTYCSRHLGSYGNSGLALFSCSGENFWQVLFLPNSPRNRIVFDKNPYVRPLSAILTEYTRICHLVIDRKEAKWYDVYMGEIFLIDSLAGNIPSQIKEGGFLGYDSKRIERHNTSQLHEYFKKADQKTFALFKKNRFDWFLLSGKDELLPDLTNMLHPYLIERLKGRARVSPGDSPSKILEKTLEIKRQLIIQEKEKLVESFLAELQKGGLSVAGLTLTLQKLNRGEVQTLLVTRHYSTPGRSCPNCRSLYEDEKICPSCQNATEKVVDIIDQAIESAMDKNSRIKHINPPSGLQGVGDIGAILRYKT
ncbi:MAG: hypothetical protein L6425_06250 [Candidatus Aminicenantes bacterium]|nr:hypothetical protein [Candidatus Aminicenantes bacterium]